MQNEVDQLAEEFSYLRIPVISKEEYVSMRRMGMSYSEMQSYDLAPPSSPRSYLRPQAQGAAYARDARIRGVYSPHFFSEKK